MKNVASSAISLLGGTLIGFVVTSQVLLWLDSEAGCDLALSSEMQVTGKPKPRLLFVGVMTAEKYLSTRALAIQRTWGKSLAGRLAFFSSSTSRWESEEELPLVALRGVDDSYPPQKKSFLMLKYMHDHYLDQYEWFMRCDDDVYVHVERLERFLRSVNSSKYSWPAARGRFRFC